MDLSLRLQRNVHHRGLGGSVRGSHQHRHNHHLGATSMTMHCVPLIYTECEGCEKVLTSTLDLSFHLESPVRNSVTGLREPVERLAGYVQTLNPTP